MSIAPGTDGETARARRRARRAKVAIGRFSALPAVAAVRRRVGWLIEAGTEGYSPDIKRRLMILNVIVYLIAVSTAGYAVQHAVLDYQTYAPLIWVNGSLILLAVIVPLAHRWSPIAGGLIVVVVEYIALMVIMALLGRPSGVHLQYLVGAAAPFVVLGLERIRLVLVIVAVGLVLHLVAYYQFPRFLAVIDAEPAVLDGIHIQAAVTTFGLIAASVWYAFSLVERAKRETDTLLRNILPDSVVERLKARPDDIIADTYADASVLFADIKGFVALARDLGPVRVVGLLNDIVREFDLQAARHGIEKIKTIGDAYMAVAGVPEPAADHTQRLVTFAHAMLRVIEAKRAETGLDLAMRIGIASGPVMAGVIGTQKFSYDVWGDTVNLASRLEGHAAPGKVLICPNCRAALEGCGFAFEAREAVEIKGVGAVTTWYVVG